jgi:hypothetical protein
MAKKTLTFEFMLYSELAKLSPQERIKRVMSIVKENKILLIEGQLKKQEEAQLIQKTMESIDNKFKGIEIAVIDPTKEAKDFFSRFKRGLASVLLGEREGFTLIGPATIVQDIKQNPHKINQLSLDLKN